MKKLGVTGYISLGRVRGRIVGQIQPHEVLELPDAAAADLKQASSRVCDLTLDPAKAPYGAHHPTPILRWRLP